MEVFNNGNIDKSKEYAILLHFYLYITSKIKSAILNTELQTTFHLESSSFRSRILQPNGNPNYTSVFSYTYSTRRIRIDRYYMF